MAEQRMESFLVAANCLNFTEAAERLYITQPALSKQIASLEKELNMQLFVRDKNGLRLTPAGRVLRDELPAYLAHYQDILAKARVAYSGYRGRLNIAILDGHIAEHELGEAIRAFRGAFPNVDIDLSRRSFRTIREGLTDRSLDAAVTLDFDIPQGASGLQTLLLRKSRAVLAMHRTHPLAGSEGLSLADFRDALFIVPEDTKGGLEKLTESCRACGFYPSTKSAKNLHAAMLEVEAGLGVSVMNEANSLRQNPGVVLMTLPELTETVVVLAWDTSNENFVLPHLIEAVKAGFHNGLE